LNALEEHAEQAENGHSIRRRLFADDAKIGFAFVDLCRKCYDVILMNPPFGNFAERIRSYGAEHYSDCKEDIDAAFIRRFSALLNIRGLLGAIVNRTELFKPTLGSWRKEILLAQNRLRTLADLGHGVLDGALVEAAAYVFEREGVGSTGVFFRLLKDLDREITLYDKIDILMSNSTLPRDTFIMSYTRFHSLPEFRMPYWAGYSIMKTFEVFDSLGDSIAEVRQGLVTADDFRFVRLALEVPLSAKDIKEGEAPFQWVPFAKGGEYSPYFGDIHLVVKWGKNGRELVASGRGRVQNVSYYFRPGITWSVRTTSGFSPRVLPKNCIFSHTGDLIWVQNPEICLSILGILMSRIVAYMIEMMVASGDAVVSGTAARSYEVGIIRSLPIPNLTNDIIREMAQIVKQIWYTWLQIDTSSETSRYFIGPSQFRFLKKKGKTASLWKFTEAAIGEIEDHHIVLLEKTLLLEGYSRSLYLLDENALADIIDEFGPHPCELPNVPLEKKEVKKLGKVFGQSIENLISRLVSKSGGSRAITKKCYFADRKLELLSVMFNRHPNSIVDARRLFVPVANERLQEEIYSLLSYLFGLTINRWDIRIALDPTIAPKLPDPYDPLPVCPPGMLVGPDGLPVEPGRIVSEEWLRARPDTITLPLEGTVKKPTIPDSDYPLCISWDGILVDDPSFDGALPHKRDIVRRIREVLDLLWKDKAHEIEQEACDILGVSDLRDYFRRPSGFFQDHLKRYSKSRRKAPIYWPLSTKSGAYTLWIYYHRLTDQTLYACINDYVNPKLNNISKDIARLQEEIAKQGSTKNRQRLEQLMDFEQELKDYRDELLRVAGLPYKPNLNDGVMITAALLWKLFRHNQWRKDLEACWKRLKEGKYDWAHLAYAIWPDRVKKKCSTDLSIAIAHDMEYLYEGDDTKPRRLRGKAQG